MHTKDAILLQTSTLVAVLVISYLIFTHPRSVVTPSAHRNNTSINVTGCGEAAIIHIVVLAQSSARVLHRLVTALDSADYGPATVVFLTIFGDYSMIENLESWRHGPHSFKTRSYSQLRVHINDTETLVIVLDDYMDPSPMYALWFLTQHCAKPNATAIAGGGGGKGLHTAGLAMSAEVWNAFLIHRATNHTSTVSVYVSRLPNASVVFPSIDESMEYAFVRLEWQDPVLMEHPPKLMRAWNPEKPWGATIH
jgi:hypothetical protein